MGIPPQVLSGIAIGAPIAGGLQQSAAIKDQASAAAAAGHYNAQQTRAAGAAEAARIRRQGRRELAKQRLRVAASGVRLEGSPLDLIAANAAEVERSAQEAEAAARQSAAIDEVNARNAKRAGRTSAATALLGGAIQGGGTALRLYGAGR